MKKRGEIMIGQNSFFLFYMSCHIGSTTYMVSLGAHIPSPRRFWKVTV